MYLGRNPIIQSLMQSITQQLTPEYSLPVLTVIDLFYRHIQESFFEMYNVLHVTKIPQIMSLIKINRELIFLITKCQDQCFLDEDHIYFQNLSAFYYI